MIRCAVLLIASYEVSILCQSFYCIVFNGTLDRNSSLMSPFLGHQIAIEERLMETRGRKGRVKKGSKIQLKKGSKIIKLEKVRKKED